MSDERRVTLEWMSTFVRVAERGSMTAVAKEIGVGQSTVTRQLRDLEVGVGVPLLSRTTRRVTLTEEGARYYEAALKLLRLAEQAGEEARGAKDAPSGTVRVSCTAALGVRHVCDMVNGFQEAHPEIAVDLGLTDERIDLVRDGVDMAIRLGPLSSSSLRLRRLGSSRRVLVAAPEYLRCRGRPQRPEDLIDHETVRMFNVAGSGRLVLTDKDGGEHKVPLSGRLRVDHGLAVRKALAAARGIAPVHVWLVDDMLSDGRLEMLLEEYTLTSVPLSLLVTPERAAIARIRLLANWIVESARKVPGLLPD